MRRSRRSDSARAREQHAAERDAEEERFAAILDDSPGRTSRDAGALPTLGGGRMVRPAVSSGAAPAGRPAAVSVRPRALRRSRRSAPTAGVLCEVPRSRSWGRARPRRTARRWRAALGRDLDVSGRPRGQRSRPGHRRDGAGRGDRAPRRPPRSSPRSPSSAADPTWSTRRRTRGFARRGGAPRAARVGVRLGGPGSPLALPCAQPRDGGSLAGRRGRRGRVAQRRAHHGRLRSRARSRSARGARRGGEEAHGGPARSPAQRRALCESAADVVAAIATVQSRCRRRSAGDARHEHGRTTSGARLGQRQVVGCASGVGAWTDDGRPGGQRTAGSASTRRARSSASSRWTDWRR